MVALLKSVMKNRLKRPLAANHDDVIAMTPGYLGNHASQKTSYYETLSVSHGRSFRIRL